MVFLLEPGVGIALFTKIGTEATSRSRFALSGVANACVKQAKTNASNGSHAYGTPTPSSPGSGPAIISSALVRSINRTTVDAMADGSWLCVVGIAEGLMPGYSNKEPTEYSAILELHGCRNGAKYPFLQPAAEFVMRFVAPLIFREKYGENWARLL